ncbi:hypothetical protein JRQ81_000135, partial [Phrynocephalus forsythii]
MEPESTSTEMAVLSNILAAYSFITENPERAALYFVSGICAGLLLTLLALVLRISCQTDCRASSKKKPPRDMDMDSSGSDNDSDTTSDLSARRHRRFERTLNTNIFTSAEEVERAHRLEERERIIREIWMNGQSNSMTKSSGFHGHDSASTSFQQNDSQENVHMSNKPSKEPCPSEQDPTLRSNSSLSASSCNSGTRLPETNLVEETVLLNKNRYKTASPQGHENSAAEWTFYPSSGNHTFHAGKKCIFDGVHLRNKTSSSERTVEMSIGKKKCVDEVTSRNGIPFVTPGDHPYACPEQSPDFHKVGSTRPPVNFGSCMYKKKLDTFIPLQHLPGIP